MKKLLSLAAAAALAFGGAAQAETIAYVNYEGGWQIRITDDRGGCTGADRFVFSTLPTGKVIARCWRFYDGFVSVTFSDSEVRRYPAADFHITPYGVANGYSVNANREAEATSARRAAKADESL